MIRLEEDYVSIGYYASIVYGYAVHGNENEFASSVRGKLKRQNLWHESLPDITVFKQERSNKYFSLNMQCTTPIILGVKVRETDNCKRLNLSDLEKNMEQISTLRKILENSKITLNEEPSLYVLQQRGELQS